MSRLPNLLIPITLGAALSLGASAAFAQHVEPPPPGAAPALPPPGAAPPPAPHGEPHPAGAPHEGHHEEAESEYPVSFVERPMTLPRLALAPELGLGISRTVGPVGVGMDLGVAFGITKNFEVNATVVPLEIRSAKDAAFHFGSPVIGGTFRFLNTGPLEMGARFQLTIYTESGAVGVTATPSVPILLHLGKVGRLDTGLEIPITAGGGLAAELKHTVVGLNVPVRLAFDIIEPLHVGLITGVGFQDLTNGNAGHLFAVPVGFFAGYAIGHGKPVVDIDGFFQWNQLFLPGAPAGLDKVEPGVWQAGIAARGYFYLGG